MRRAGSLALADHLGDVVYIECQRRGRAGRYPLDRRQQTVELETVGGGVDLELSPELAKT